MSAPENDRLASTPGAGACAGLRVLDLTDGLAGPMATMILADFGAEVVRVEPAGGDPGWDTPGYLLLQRGKQSIDLDVSSPAGQEEIRRLIPGFDVVVESLGPDVADQAGIGYDALSALNPGLVYAAVTGWGRTGPFAHLKADDALVMAKSGIMRYQPGWHGGSRPIFRSCPDPSYFAGMLLVQGVLAALRVRDLTGEGQLVETNLLQALTCRQNPAVRWLLREGEELPLEAKPGGPEILSEKHVLPHHMDPRVINLIGMRVETKDGRWLVHSHTEPKFFPAWIETIGLEWIWDDDRFKGAPHDVSLENKDELISIVQKRMKEKTAEEWMELYVANGNVCGDAIQTTQQALRHPQTTEAGLVVTIEDPRVGTTVQVGPLARIPGAPASVGRPAPLPGADTDAVVGAQVSPVAVPPGTGASPARPLEGVTIVEAAYYYATPFATALLAELGARVIKIEPLRKDPYRIISSYGKGDPVLNLGHNNMVRAFQGKEDIALNLKDPAGQEILRRMVEKADVFVHSFRSGVPESLGIDEATLRQINPDLLYHYGASYGSTGPYAKQPAIDPIIAAYAGTTAHQAGEGNAPLTETGADPVAATGHATAMMLGLFARDRSHHGQSLESWMIVSNIYLNAQDAISYEGKPPRTEVDGLQHGTGPTYRLYETGPVSTDREISSHANPTPHWVFLAAEHDDEFARFCEVAGRPELATDPRFATEADRATNHAALATELEALFATRSAPEWEELMVAQAVGCVMADAVSHFAFLYEDAQAKAIDMMTTAEHPSFGGTYWRYAPLLHFSKTPGVAGAFCEFGEHTRAILAELGYSNDEMAELKANGVVAWPDE
jgi:crotonobetainyl-CoA:carnitine CoA-transferase CaiB-like acyl-CoA transferase